jgi:hypothetical protein
LTCAEVILEVSFWTHATTDFNLTEMQLVAEFTSKPLATWFFSNRRIQIKQPPSMPNSANQNLKRDVFHQKFVKLGQMPICRNTGWTIPKIHSAETDTNPSYICPHFKLQKLVTIRPL